MWTENFFFFFFLPFHEFKIYSTPYNCSCEKLHPASTFVFGFCYCTPTCPITLRDWQMGYITWCCPRLLGLVSARKWGKERGCTPTPLSHLREFGLKDEILQHTSVAELHYTDNWQNRPAGGQNWSVVLRREVHFRVRAKGMILMHHPQWSMFPWNSLLQNTVSVLIDEVMLLWCWILIKYPSLMAIELKMSTFCGFVWEM